MLQDRVKVEMVKTGKPVICVCRVDMLKSNERTSYGATVRKVAISGTQVFIRCPSKGKFLTIKII